MRYHIYAIDSLSRPVPPYDTTAESWGDLEKKMALPPHRMSGETADKKHEWRGYSAPSGTLLSTIYTITQYEE